MLNKYRFIPFVKLFISLLTGVVLFAACDKFDNEQTIPAYIHIDKIILIHNQIPINNEGSLSNRITDAWVYVDDHLIGAFELPATFPVLSKGKHNISIYPGIKMNGMSGTRVVYEFYNKIDIPGFNFIENTISTIDTSLTTTSYKSNVVIWGEDFEGSTAPVKFQKRPLSDTNIIKTNMPSNVFEGGFSGQITIDATHSYFEIEPIGDNFKLPKNSSPVFIELNYKTNNSFYVGLMAYQSGQTLPSNQIATISIRPTTEWKKIYINLTPDLIDNYSYYSYKFFISGFKDEGVQTASIFLDNVKLVYFNY
ncbi:MAG: hypothetical protein NTZ33_14820 [Bacteroidetes bacterium]|nr:hypothetical protein [Bacteroidota bacterium]